MLFIHVIFMFYNMFYLYIDLIALLVKSVLFLNVFYEYIWIGLDFYNLKTPLVVHMTVQYVA